ncbi:filamentous hemagglutinin N-terminal domain-containing protein [Bordetella sp. N]|uniref:filamentous hemagglutinin N-terminal domain-containing protein n=1 Tax=Bordetella sp. N TaxID=1746199 RepID=UPI00070AE024|nr:filamentous hemagglutinin N-terminal domain-containing protein [Bordetella sp. N]ALM84350.1 hypothetical protein ASB57_16470 [Bordetella sp. N]
MKRLSRSYAQRNIVLPVRRPPLKRQGSMPALTTLAVVIGSVVSGGAQANPTGGNVVAGSASINNAGNGTVNINQSSGKAIINWQGFSIGANETVNFVQPGSKSVTLNRVVGNDPSAIFGKLNANGTVMLVNPNGVVFGKSARVDVGGLVATTANIRDDDFMAGRYKFDQASSKLNAMVINEGQISIKDSGLAALVAPAVQNSGVIEAKLGKVALAGARTFTVDFQGDGLLSFDATSVVSNAPKDANGKAVGALVSNTGVIRADGGTVLMTARAVKDVVDNVINTDGIVSAKSVGTRNGKIVLSGGDAGSVNVAGTLDVSGANAGEQGGKVVVTGQNVKVASGAVIDASGAVGGGEIALGSQGVTPDDGSAAYSNKSATVTVAAGATLKADALDKGKGGNVTLWSTDNTTFAGTISARGGVNGGDGGFAEVSAEKNISLTGTADLRAAKGQIGTLLIDPETIEITSDIASSNTGNAVSRGWLEAQAANSNITLSATGQITIDAMPEINLQTQAGSTFTLQSTTSGGIRFVDSNTVITTQGGNIYLQALGVGSSLDNIGSLVTQGGNITLQASGNINLANALNAGNGAVSIASTAGSIYNTGGAAQIVAGGSVKLDAEAANVGAPGAALNTATSVLAISTGGDMVVANAGTLSSLAINSRHAQAGKTNTYGLTSSGLTFDVTDGASYGLNNITQAGLNLSFTGDRSIAVGTVTTGSGAVALTSTTGSITGNAGTLITAGNLTLQAATAIGSASQALTSAAGNLTATALAGGINLSNSGATNLGNINATGNVSVLSGGALYLGGAFNAGANTALTSTTGNIDASADTLIRTTTLSLSGISAGATRALQTTASTVNAAVGDKLDVVSSATSLTAGNVSSQSGNITITGAGELLANNVSSGGGAISLKGQAVLLNGNINAGAGSVTLTSDGIIANKDNNNTSLITAAQVYLYAPVAANPSNGSAPTYTIGTSQSALRTAAGELTATAGSIYLNQVSGALKLDSLKAYQDISVQAAAGVTVNQVDAGLGRLSIKAGGDILAAVPANLLSGTSIELNAAQGTLGADDAHINTSTSALTLTSGQDIYLDNSGKTLTSLNITNTHQSPGTYNVLEITSPYLSFNVTDDGSVYHFNDVYSAPLNSFLFSGDQGMVLGNIRVGTTASFTASRGNITDDGDAETRVTAYYLTLVANNGYIGTADDAIDTNTSSLTATTRGNLYVGSISDLNTLSVTALHNNSSDVYDLQVQAPSLLFKVLDSTSGHTLADVSDTSGLNFTFVSDRDITVGSVNTTSSGYVSLTSKTGSIKDDGDKSTVLVADGVSLLAQGAIGAEGDDHLDILARTLSAQASAGGVYIQLPSPTGSTNFTGTITLGGIYAYNGNVVIDAVQGDLALSSTVYSPNGNVTLTAQNGSILNSNGYGMITAFGNNVTLTAAGSIGGADVPVETYQTAEQGRRSILFNGSAPVTITANATGGDVYLQAIGTAGDITLASVTAGKQVQYQQAAGDTIVGTVTGVTQVSLTNTSGSILDDGDSATAITAPVVALTANGAIGSIGETLTLAAADVSLTNGGQIAIHNTEDFDRLDITRTSGVVSLYDISGPNLTNFALTEDNGAYYLSDIATSNTIDFGFTGYNKSIRVGTIDAGAAGTVRLSTNGNIVNDDEETPGSITASTVALSAGSGSIGSTSVVEDENGDPQTVFHPISLIGTSKLTLSGAGDMYVDSDTALTGLSIINTSTSTVERDLAVTADSQTYKIHDFGTYLSLMTIDGAGVLNDFSLSAKKGLRTNALAANDSISLEVDAAANMDSTIVQSTGSIVANKLTLTVIGQNGAAFIGVNGGSALQVSTSDLSIATNGGININNGGRTLDSLTLDFSDRKVGSTVVYPTYTFGGLGSGNSLTMGYGGSTLSMAGTLTGTDFSVISLGSISVGAVSTGAGQGSISLTALGDAAAGLNGYVGGTGTLTSKSVSLTATGKGGNIGNGGVIQTATSNLELATSGSVAVSNSGTLDSLSLTALHDGTINGQVNSYNITSAGLSFGLTDNGPNSVYGMTANITATNGLDLSVSTDRALTLGHVETAGTGSVALTSTGIIYGTHLAVDGVQDIITGDLTLNAQSVQGKYNANPGEALYVSVNTLSSDVDQTLWVSNNKTLTLRDNSAGSWGNVVATNGDILQDGTGRYVTPILSLTAINGSVGAVGNAILTDTRQLSASSGGNLVLDNTSDLFSLNLSDTHAANLGSNVLQVTAKGLDFRVTDTGSNYVLTNVTDVSGLSFTFTGDRALSVGNLDTGPAQSVTLSGLAIHNIDADSHITAGQIDLLAGSTIGDAGSSIATNTRDLGLTSGGDIYVANDVDLSSLSIISTAVSATPTIYSIVAPELTFTVTDDGSKYILGNVADNTGLNFSFKSQRSQEVGSIDVLPTGSVNLSTAGNITAGNANGGVNINAGDVSLWTFGTNGNIGANGNKLTLSTPQLNVQNTGDLYVSDSKHLDALSIYATGASARTYSVDWASRDGSAVTFNVTDDGSKMVVNNVTDTAGVDLSLSSTRGIQVGTINVGLDDVSLSALNSALTGDGSSTTRIDAAGLTLSGDTSVGAIGNAIETNVNTLSAYSRDGGVSVGLNAGATVTSFSARGDSSLTNLVGDISLGSIELYGHGLTVDNQGGSILSGTINDASAVSLTAAGSIGNVSAIKLQASGAYIVPVDVTLHATDANGADGSIALTADYGLKATDVVGTGDITLASGGGGTGSYDLTVGNVSTTNGDVTLTAQRGNILGADGANNVAGASVTLTTSTSGASIGSGTTGVNVDTKDLTINNSGSFYVADSADLDRLTINRTPDNTGGSSGTMSLTASGLTFSAADSGTSTLTNVVDTTGLDFSYTTRGSISVGTIDVGSGAAALTAGNGATGSASITATSSGSLIKAGDLTLTANSSAGSTIGSTGQALNLQVTNLTSTSGGSTSIQQNGTINLENVNAGGALSVVTSGGDILVGQVKNGSNANLTLWASGGSILANGGSISTSGTGAISLTAADGIGSDSAALELAAASKTVSATVTGSGSLNLAILDSLTGGLTTTVTNGSTNITSAGAIKLTNLTSSTDAAGNDINVTAESGNISLGVVTAGSKNSGISLTAQNGSIVGTGTVVSAYRVTLDASGDVGGAGTAVIAVTSPRIEANSTNGSVYLQAGDGSILSYATGKNINVEALGNLQVANAVATDSIVVQSASLSPSVLVAGNIDAGTGSVQLLFNTTGSSIIDDGNAATRIIGSTVSLFGSAGIGGAAPGDAKTVQTTTSSLSASSVNGNIYIDDNRAAGIDLHEIGTNDGAVAITTAGDTVVTRLIVNTPRATNTVSIDAGGDLKVIYIGAGYTAGVGAGDVTLKAAGDISGTSGTLIYGNTLNATAGGNIGSVTDTTMTNGGALITNVSHLGDLTTQAAGVIAIDNRSASSLSVGTNTDPGTGGTLSVRNQGNLDASSGIVDGLQSLLLSSNGTLILPEAALNVAGNATLKGVTDVVADGATPRTLNVNADSLTFTSGAAGGDTKLVTEVETINAKLTNTSSAANLTVDNTGDLDATLRTSNGDITVTNDGDLTATSVQAAGNIDLSATGKVDAVSVVATGAERAISITADGGDIGIGTIDAGSTDGQIVLTALQGKIANLGDSDSLTAYGLTLTARDGIGDTSSPLRIEVSEVTGSVTGTGGLYLSGSDALTLNDLTTNDGDISITTRGDLVIKSDKDLVAGNGGNVTLHSIMGDVSINKDIVAADMGSLTVIDFGGTVTLGNVTTSGAQSYYGNDVKLGGDLVAGSIEISGRLALTGNDPIGYGRSLSTAAANGDISIQTVSDGNMAALTLDAGSGKASISSSAANLYSLTVTGEGNYISDVTTLREQTYNGTTALAGSFQTTDAAFTVNGDAMVARDVTVNTVANNGTVGGAVWFGGRLVSNEGASYGLQVDAGTADVTFNGVVGQEAVSLFSVPIPTDSGARLGDLTVNTAGATVFNDKVYAASVTTDDPGTLALNGSLIDTTGNQYFGELAVLGTNVTLKGASVTLNQGAEGSTAGGQSLTIDGEALISGVLGADKALAALTVTGPTSLNLHSVNTTGAQSYQGDVVFIGDVDLKTTGGNVAFGGTVDGPGDLTITAQSGNVSFGGAVGSNLTLDSLTVDTTGTVAINGGSVTTWGEQDYNGRVTLGADTILAGDEVHLNAGADGAHSLIIGGRGIITGAVGAQQALSSLTVTEGTILNQGSIATTGSQTYEGIFMVRGDQQLSTQGGDVLFDGSVSGNHNLSVAANGGKVNFTHGVGVGGDVDPIAALTVDTSGSILFGAKVRAASVTTLGKGTVALAVGDVVTTGAQSYDSRVVMSQDTVLKGTQVALLNGGDGAHALTIDGNATLGGTLGANQALSSVTVKGTTVFNDGSITTTGDQNYTAAVTTVGTQALTSRAGDVVFAGTVDGAGAGSGGLVVQAAGDVTFDGAIGATTRAGNLSVTAGDTTHFVGAIRAASLTTGSTGTLALDAGSVDTTGNQRYGQHLVLSKDTTLTGANVALLAGVDAAQAGTQALHIAGNAAITGDVGGSSALRSLAIDGSTAMNAGSVQTVGDQTYGGAVALSGARNLISNTGSVIFGSTLDGAGNNLAINAAQNIAAAGDFSNVGNLTLNAVDTIVFNGAVGARRVQQLQAQSATYGGKLTASGADGIDLTGGSFTFGGDVSADAGAIKIAGTDAAGSVKFAAGSTVQAATTFTQSGAATLLLPARLSARDSVTLGAVGQIQGTGVAITTQGDITMPGLYGPQATATLTLGSPSLANPLGGKLSIGLNDADPNHKLNVRVLAVPTAGSAQVYGSIGGRSGAVAAAFVTSPLVGAPYFMNATPWGPNDIVQRLAAATAPRWVAPSKPGVDSLFRGTVPNNAFGPDVLGAYADPQVLKVSLVDIAP